MTDFPHLFCHFLLFHFSNSSHLCPSVSPPLASFSHPSPACSFASFRQQDSVGHSGPLGPWLPPSLCHDPVGHSGPLGLLRVFFLSLLPLCNLGSVGHSGPLSPLLPPYLLSLAFNSLFTAFPPRPRLSQSFRLTRSLAISSPFLASALPLFIGIFEFEFI